MTLRYWLCIFLFVALGPKAGEDASVRAKNQGATIALSELAIDGKSHSSNLSAQPLSFNNACTIELTLKRLGADNLDKLNYQYRLNGYSAHWRPIGKEPLRLAFIDLPGGQYQLEVQVIDAQSHTVAQSTLLSFNITPSFWQRPISWLIAFSLLMMFIYLLIKWRTATLKKDSINLWSVIAKRTAELETLTEVTKELNATLDVQSITDRLQKHLAATIDAHVFALAIIDLENNKLRFRNVIENNKPLEPFDISLDNDEHVAIVCIRQNKPIIMDKFEDSLKYVDRPSKPMAGKNMQSVLYFPLTSHDDKVIGCITVQTLKQNAYSESDIKLMSSLASSAAIALENARAYQALEKVSLTDYLTGLPNRRAFFDTAKTMVARVKRNQPPFAVALADIDYFKNFNDTFGHDTGDYILQSLSNLMKEAIREQDIICRWGGEEFIFLFPETSLEGALVVAEKLRNAIAESSFNYENHQLELTITFGVTVFIPGESLQECINRADNLLYKGKADGRNRVVGELSNLN